MKNLIWIIPVLIISTFILIIREAENPSSLNEWIKDISQEEFTMLHKGETKYYYTAIFKSNENEIAYMEKYIGPNQKSRSRTTEFLDENGEDIMNTKKQGEAFIRSFGIYTILDGYTIPLKAERGRKIIINVTYKDSSQRIIDKLKLSLN
tara:strand:+ start:69 stop:518 length:450 start_codon:yes stop_codon:yes gene_type:complete